MTRLLLAPAIFVVSACSQTFRGEDTPLIAGMDHIALAVADLDRAAERYGKLGFTLKPGRVHENGIQNQHIKFPNGTEIELISADEARDSLTAEYLKHLASGDGAAFVGLYAPDMNRLVDRFDADEITYRYDGRLLTFPESYEMRYMFFGPRTPSVTDLPEHFEHQNSATALIGVWIAGDELDLERQLLSALGATITEQEVHVPGVLEASVAKLQQAEVLLLPGSQQLVSGRRIIGATIRTRDLDALRDVLADASWNVSPAVVKTDWRSIFIPPTVAHGIWLEFRQDGGA